MLCDALQDSGAVDLSAIYKRPSDSLYGLLTSDIRSASGSGRFTFMGNGIFAASSITVGLDGVAVEPPAKSRAEPKRRALPVLERQATCGDCAFMRQSQLQALQNTRGSCAHSSSGRDYPELKEFACDMFAMKDMGTLEREHKELLAVQALVAKVNKAILRRRTTIDGQIMEDGR